MTDSFMKGFAQPRMLINKLSFVSTNTKFNYINLIIDLLQEHPELFVDTATTLIYLLNIGTNYKKDILFQMFQSYIYTDYAEQKEINNLIQNHQIEEPIIISDSMPILFSYYLYKNKVFKSFEPSMKDIETAFKVFSNNPEVYYDSKKYDFNEFN